MPPSLGGRGSRVEGRLPPSFNSAPRVRPDALRGKSPFTAARDQKLFSGGPQSGGMTRVPQGRTMVHMRGVAGGSPVVGTRRRANTEPVSPTSFKAGGRDHNSSEIDKTLGEATKNGV